MDSAVSEARRRLRFPHLLNWDPIVPGAAVGKLVREEILGGLRRHFDAVVPSNSKM